MDSVMQRMDARSRREAERASRTPQENYLFDRKERLKNIQKAELLQDKTLLKSIKKPRTNSPWFVSQDVDNNSGGILEQLSSFFLDDLGASKLSIRQTADELSGSAYFNVARNYKTFENPLDKSGLEGPSSLIKSAAWLQELIEENGYSPHDAPGSNDEAEDVLDEGFEALNNVYLLLRFVDERNAKMEEYPNSDGSNLLEDDLKMAWLLHRAWIRTLHLRSLELGSESFGWNHLQQIMKLGIALHIAELQRVPMKRIPDRRTPALYGDVLQTMQHEYLTTLSNVSKDLRTERRTDRNYTTEETLAYNMRPARFIAILTKRIDDFVSDESSMLAYFISRNNKLEHVMNEEHVEDVLMSKRVVIKDENFATFDIVQQKDYTHRTIRKLPNRNQQFDYKSRVRKISQINRKRRNYLLLRDWSKKRPWKQLYEQCDLTYNTGWKKCIRDFYSRIDELKELERGERPGPSSPANVWSSIWPIHPIASHDDEIEGQGPFRPPHFDGGCVICCDKFVSDSKALIVTLHCGHIFHFTCIRDHWDHEDHYQTRCPTCRSGSDLGGWYLHEVAGIYPEALDLFDNRIIAHDAIANRHSYNTDPAWRARYTETQQLIMTDPDLGDLFKEQSWGQYEDSVHWGAAKRDPEIEMIHWRRRRRMLNKRHREVLRQDGQNIAKAFGPPPEVEEVWTGPTAEQILQRERDAATLAGQLARAAAYDAEAARVAEAEMAAAEARFTAALMNVRIANRATGIDGSARGPVGPGAARVVAVGAPVGVGAAREATDYEAVLDAEGIPGGPRQAMTFAQMILAERMEARRRGIRDGNGDGSGSTNGNGGGNGNGDGDGGANGNRNDGGNEGGGGGNGDREGDVDMG